MKTIILCLALMLAGCGGGDWDEEELRKESPPLDCKATPHLCG